MAYVKQNYQPGDVLTAEQVNKIQDTIIKNEGNIDGHIVDNDNPHGVTPEQIGAVSLGFGYGETLAIASGSTEADLETSLTTVLSGMANYTTKQVRCSISFETGSSTYTLATIYKHTSAYAVVLFETVSGNTLKKIYSNGWQPLEWENPPMVRDVEYRTTERCNNKPVYRKRIVHTSTVDVGSTSGGAGLIVQHGITYGSLVRINGFANCNDGTVKPFMPTSVTSGTDGKFNIAVNNEVWSKPTVVIDVGYIKS